MGTENQSIFTINGKLPNTGYGVHNVGTGVLRSSSPELQAYVEDHYGQRCGHLPDSKEVVGVLVPQVTRAISDQMDYIGGLIDRPIEVRQINQAPHNSLIVPYIRTTGLEADLGSERRKVWGLPPVIVDELKNKAVTTADFATGEYEPFRVPDFRVCNVDNLVPTSLDLLRRTSYGYQMAGMSGTYPLGLMLRAAECDGGYGNNEIAMDSKGGVVVIPNGDVSHARSFTGWVDALKYAEENLRNSINVDKEPRVVVSRRIDAADSPGNSVLFKDGEAISMGWNGNVQNPQFGVSSVGTTNYQPTDAALKEYKSRHEEQTAEALARYVRKKATDFGIDHRSLTGFASVDLLLPGPLEREYLSRIGQDPNTIYFCEVNPRITNWTDALMLIARVNGNPVSPSSLRETIQGRVLTIDKHPVRNGATPTEIRCRIQELDRRLQYLSGSRVVLRMADKPAGIIYTGDIQTGLEETNRIL